MSENENEVYEEEAFEIVTLEYDDGETEDFELIDVFEHEGQDYIALGPLTEEEKDSAFLYHYIEEDEDTFFAEPIESDELYEAVAATFMALQEEAEE